MSNTLNPATASGQLVQKLFSQTGDKLMRKKHAPLAVFIDVSQTVLLWKHLCFTSFVARGWDGGFGPWPRHEGGNVWPGK